MLPYNTQSTLGVPVCMKPSLTSIKRTPDTRGSYVARAFMPVYNQLKCQFLVKTSISSWYGTYRRARTFTHALTECLNKREKRSTSRCGPGASYQTSHPGISARAIAFGRSRPFAAFCYWPTSASKAYETNPTPTHSSRPPLSLQFYLRIRSLKYTREKSFCLSYGKHWSRKIPSHEFLNNSNVQLRRHINLMLVSFRSTPCPLGQHYIGIFYPGLFKRKRKTKMEEACDNALSGTDSRNL